MNNNDVEVKVLGKSRFKTVFSKLRGKRAVKGLIIAFSITLLFSVMASLYASQLPLEVNVENKIASYSHKALYNCLIELSPNTIYNKTLIAPDQKVFLKLTRRINVSLVYYLSSTRPLENLRGFYSLTLKVESPDIWSKSFVIKPPTNFNGSCFTYTTSIDMSWFNSLVSNITREIGLYSSKYVLTLEAVIHVEATIAGRNISEDFNPSMRAEVSYADSIITFDGLQHESTSSITEPESRVAYIRLMGLQISVSDSRLASYSLAAFSAVGLAFSAVSYNSRRKPKLREVIAKKYGDVVVDVEGEFEFERVLIVKSFDDILKLAQGLEKPILHYQQGEEDYYVVANGPEVYLYKLKEEGDAKLG